MNCALVARTVSHSFASLTCEILFLPLEHKVHFFSSRCIRIREKKSQKLDSKILPSGQLQYNWKVQDRSCGISKERKCTLVKFSFYTSEELQKNYAGKDLGSHRLNIYVHSCICEYFNDIFSSFFRSPVQCSL